MPDFRDYFTSEALNPPRLLEEVKLMARKFAWDPAQWRFRAEEARTVADEMTHEEARAIVRRIANDYDRLAKLAEEQLLAQEKGATGD